jgi:hypothetical protein
MKMCNGYKQKIIRKYLDVNHNKFNLFRGSKGLALYKDILQN